MLSDVRDSPPPFSSMKEIISSILTHDPESLLPIVSSVRDL